MILRSAWVLPVSAPPIADGFVEIAGERISRVGSWTARPVEWAGFDVTPLSEPPGPLLNLGDALLLPGFVNPHTHLELTCYAGQIDPAPFWDWIRLLIDLRGDPAQLEREGAAVADGAWRSLRAGVTCVGDISRRNVHWQQLARVPIRKVCFVELLTLADHPPRNPRELREALRAVQEDALLTAGLSPHAPYTVPADQIRATVELAAEERRAWCTHWAETVEEVAFLRGQVDALPRFVVDLAARHGIAPPGCGPLEYLDRCTAGLPSGALAHCNYLDDDDIERLAAAGHMVMYCPRAHTFFGHEPHPLQRLRAAGVPVALATDSLASNWSLSILDEMRYVYERVADAPRPEELLAMATLTGARALGLDGQIGSLEAGKLADLVSMGGAADIAEPLERLMRGKLSVQRVWVGGREVVTSEK